MSRKYKFLSWFTFFDAIALSVLVSLAIVFFLFFYRKSQTIDIKVKITDQEVIYAGTNPKNWYADKFQIGDAELDGLGRKQAEIIKVDKIQTTPTNKAVYVTLRVRSLFDTRSRSYSVRGKPISFGTPLRFTLSKVSFDGIVTDFPNAEFDEKTTFGQQEIKTLARGVEPKIAATVRVGQIITDSNNKTLAEVLEVNITPAERVTQTDSGELLLRRDPLYKDLEVVLKVQSRLIERQLHIFDDIPLKIGEVVPLNFDNFSLFPFVTEIQKLGN